MTRLLGLVLCSLCLAGMAAADTTWVAAGTVAGQWEAAGNPYMIMGNIRILPTDQLDIGQGVTVYFTGPFRVIVDGVLNTHGTPDGKVIFTADTAQVPTGWKGLRMASPPRTLYFDYTIFEYSLVMGDDQNGLGGAMFCDNARVEMTGCLIRYCHAAHGHAIYARNHSLLILRDCQIKNNGLAAGNGGAISARNLTTVTLLNCTVENNIAAYGGGISLDGSDLLLDHCVFAKNDAVVWGGAIFGSSSNLTASYSEFRANASIGGGAIDGRLHLNADMDHCLFVANTAERQGAQGPGGAAAFQSGEQTFTACTFARNQAATGGALVMGLSTQADNCIFAFQGNGGGLHFPYVGASVSFSCIAGNTGGDFDGAQVPAEFGVLTRVNTNGDSCDIYRNLYLDPQFSDSSEYEYQLAPDSPCIDAGDPTQPQDPDGSLPDIGAYYFDQATAAEPGAPAQARLSALHPAYPNPFNATAQVSFDVARAGDVSLCIYDLLGREVTELAHGVFQPGSYTLPWRPSAAPAGTYFAVLSAPGVHSVQKLLLLK